MENDRKEKGVSAVIGNLIMACMIVATGTGVVQMLQPTLESMNKIENDMYQFNKMYSSLNDTKTVYVYNTTYVSTGDGIKTPKVYITFNNITNVYDVIIQHNNITKIFSTSKENALLLKDG